MLYLETSHACLFTYSMWLRGSIFIAEPRSYLCQVGGQHVVCVRCWPHHHYGLARLADTGKQHKSIPIQLTKGNMSFLRIISPGIHPIWPKCINLSIFFFRDSLIFPLITCMQSQLCWNGSKRTSLNGKIVLLSLLTQEEPRGMLGPLVIGALTLVIAYFHHISFRIYSRLDICWFSLSLSALWFDTLQFYTL